LNQPFALHLRTRAFTAAGRARETPAKFVFAAKVPQIIAHEKVLVDCQSDCDPR